MKKKTRNYFIIGIILIVILGFIGSNYYKTGKIFPFATVGSYQCSGGQVLSISDAQIYTSAELNGKKVIRVVFSTLPSAECLYISLSPSSINSALSDADKAKFTATNTILGDVRLLKEQKVYNINERTSEKFRIFDIKTGSRDWTGSCTDSHCTDQFGSTNFINSPYVNSQTNQACGSANCCCSYFSEKGINGEFSISESLLWEAKIDIGSDSLTLNQNTLSGKIGNIAFAKWSANLVSNDQLGSITNRQAYKPYSDNKWRMTDLVWQDLSNKFTTRKSDLLNCQNSLGFGDCSSQLTNIFDYNSEFSTKTSNQLNTWVSGNTLIKDASISSNQLIVNLNSAIVYPTFTLDIDAAQVGIFISSGQPQVTCPTISDVLVSGQTKDVVINLKNIGADSGSFTYGLSCNKGSQTLSPSPPQTISSGTTKTITSRLGLTVLEGKDTSSCTFTAKDLNSLKTDSCTFSYSSEHQSQCIEGTKSCELGNAEIWTCLANGGYSKVKCPYGCYYDGTNYNCANAINDTNITDNKCQSCDDYALSYLLGSIWKSKSCDPTGWTLKWSLFFIRPPQGTTTCLLSLIKLILVPIVFIFGFLFLNEFLASQFKKLRGKKQNIIRMFISLILAGLISFLVYIAFIVGIIIFILIIVIRIALSAGMSYIKP